MAENNVMPFPDDFLNQVITLEDPVTRDTAESVIVPTLESLPTPNSLLNLDFYDCGQLDGMYAYFALVVHLMGKQITEVTREVIEVRRPSNLVDSILCVQRHDSSCLDLGR